MASELGTWTGKRRGKCGLEDCIGFVPDSTSDAASARTAARLLCATIVTWRPNDDNGPSVRRNSRGRLLASEYEDD